MKIGGHPAIGQGGAGLQRSRTLTAQGFAAVRSLRFAGRLESGAALSSGADTRGAAPLLNGERASGQIRPLLTDSSYT